MAGCGAAYEARYWGRDLKIVCVEKANIERSGAVAQGLYAINCYMGMQWGENQPEDYVRYARNDLMGLVREDLGYDIARHVDSTVHKFEEWGLPIMKDPKTGRYQREGKWQIMIHGESYKPIVAEAARKAATGSLQPDHGDPPADGQDEAQPSCRRRRFQRPQRRFLRFPREGRHRSRRRRIAHLQAPRRSAKAWDERGMRPGAAPQPTRCRFRRRQDDADGEPDRPHPLQGRLRPGRRLFPASQDLHRKCRMEKMYEANWYRRDQGELVGDYVDRHPVPTCLRNHALLEEVKAGRGPIRMVTKKAFQDPHKETVGWENFLGMTIGQAVVWASQNIDPKANQSRADHVRALRHGLPRHVLRRLGQRTGGLRPLGIPVGIQPDDDRRGLFGAGDTIGGTAHKFSSGSFTEGRIAAKGGGQLRQGSGHASSLRSAKRRYEESQEDHLPSRMENYRVGRNEIVAGTVSPSYILPTSWPSASREDHGRICRRHRLPLHDQRTAAHPGPRIV